MEGKISAKSSNWLYLFFKNHRFVLNGIKILSLALLTSPLICVSQINSNTNLPSVMPSNPQAFQFLKYGEIPVSKYTGMPSIEIPIFTIKTNGLDIPISLTYHSNGFRVNEEAGWTGLGWTLQGAGSINQVVAGTDDFGHYSGRILPNFTQIDPNMPAQALSNCTQFYIRGSLGSTNGIWACPHPEVNAQNVSGLVDSEPDTFKFNALGYSGSFILNWQTEQFICTSDSNIKIDCPNYINSSSLPTEFIISVPDGHKFRFLIQEVGNYVAHKSTSEEYGNTSAGLNLKHPDEKAFRTFQLVEVVTSGGDVINYNYDLSQEYNGYPSVSKNLTFFEPNSNSVEFNSIGGFRQFDITNAMMATRQRQSYLSSINFRGGSISFYKSDRTDLAGGKKLDQIVIKNTIENSIVKSFNLNYSYFSGHTLGTNLDSFFTFDPSVDLTKSIAELTQRLKLVSVTENGQQPYTFEYFETVQLPKKTSLATDYWGYYNGYLTNNSMFPNLYSFNFQRNNLLLEEYGTNFKGPSLEHTKAAVLKKIKYPTGGTSEFEYELNTFGNYNVPTLAQGAAATVQVSTKPGFNSYQAISIEGGSTIFRGSAFLSTTGCSDPNAYTYCKIKIQHFSPGLLTYIKSNTLLKNHYESYGLQYVLGADLNLLNGPNPANQSLYNSYHDMADLYLLKTYNSPADENLSNLLYNLPEGIVIFSAHGGCGTYGSGSSSTSSGNISQATMTLNFRAYNNLQDGDSVGAGLRIKTLSNYTSSSELSQKKIFDYEGGKLMSPLVYAIRSEYKETEHRLRYDGTCTLINFSGTKFTFSSNSYAQLSTSASGSFVGYNKITERIIANTYISGPVMPSKGKIVSFYTNTPDQSTVGDGSAQALSNPVVLPPIVADLQNGLLLKEQIFDNDNHILEEVNNTYAFEHSLTCSYGARFAVEAIKVVDEIQCTNQKCQTIQIGAYPIKRANGPKLLSNEKISYFSSNSVRTFSEYQYDSHNQLAYIKTSNSNGNNKETFNYYSYDFPSDATYSAMASSNFIRPIVKSVSKVDGNPINVSKNVYTFMGAITSAGVYFPSKFLLKRQQFAKSGIDDDLADLSIIKSFDIYGNPTEISVNGGPSTYYVWGYLGKYPVAKIENSSFTEFGTYLNAISVASDSGNIAGLKTGLSNLRSGLPNALVTTCIYKPLIGVVAIIDPKGYSTHYEYDISGRLTSVKDQDNNILSENEYHYKN